MSILIIPFFFFFCYLSKAKISNYLQVFLWAYAYLYGEGNGTPFQYSCLENPMDGGAWWAAVHGVAKSRTRLSDFTFTFHFHAWEKDMATHSSVLAWRIPGTGELGGLKNVQQEPRWTVSCFPFAIVHCANSLHGVHARRGKTTVTHRARFKSI